MVSSAFWRGNCLLVQSQTDYNDFKAKVLCLSLSQVKNPKIWTGNMIRISARFSWLWRNEGINTPTYGKLHQFFFSINKLYRLSLSRDRKNNWVFKSTSVAATVRKAVGEHSSSKDISCLHPHPSHSAAKAMSAWVICLQGNFNLGTFLQKTLKMIYIFPY